jgi:error-prone DNA polymerase
VVLTGCRKGTVRTALDQDGGQAAADALADLRNAFGREYVVVELTDRGYPTDSDRNDLLAGLARDAGLPMVATNAVRYAHPSVGRLAAAMAVVRARRSLEEMAGWLPPAPDAFLKSGAYMVDRMLAARPAADQPPRCRQRG